MRARSRMSDPRIVDRENRGSLSHAAVQQTRQLLTSLNFDATNYIDQQIASVVSTTGTDENNSDFEKSLYTLFDHLTAHLITVSEDIESDISQLQIAALGTESLLLGEIEDHSEALIEVHAAVGEVMANFDKASEGAVRIGGRLTISEKERLRIESAVKLMDLIKAFEDPVKYAGVKNMSSMQLRKSLPGGMHKDDWGAISLTLHDLRRILNDINSKDVQVAQKNIISISEVVEAELLGEFDVSLGQLMEHPNNPDILYATRQLAEWLHLFNSGQSLQTRYIFSVVQNRIPNDSLFHGVASAQNGGSSSSSSHLGAGGEGGDSSWNIGKVLSNIVGGGGGGFDDDDEIDDSSAGASIESVEPITVKGLTGFTSTASLGISGPGASSSSASSSNNNNTYSNNANPSVSLIDNLSGLFNMINSVCREQFVIIRKVFPLHTVARTTRSLVQRVFNDPAFGIQHRVDEVLRPSPPLPSLPLPAYLDALLTIREKLSALYLLLLECSTHPSMRGMGSDSAALRRAQISNRRKAAASMQNVLNNNSSSPFPGGGGGRDDVNTANGNANLTAAESLVIRYDEEAEDEAEERLRSDAEIQEFFQDQISQVLANYVSDYFEKESQHACNQYSKLIIKAIDDASVLTTVDPSAGIYNSTSSNNNNRNSTGKNGKDANNRNSARRASLTAGFNGVQTLNFPKLKPEKLRSLSQIVKSVANKGFLNAIFAVTSDAVQRMESIGRDDKRLPSRLKDLFLLELNFLSQGLILPWSQACVAILTKISSARSSSASVPPTDVIPLLSALSFCAQKLRVHFENVFAKPLGVAPNTLAICTENMKKVFKAMENAAKEQMGAWTSCIVMHVEKLLHNLQSKYDYNPKVDYIMPHQQGQDPTATCEAVCSILQQIASAVKLQKVTLEGLNTRRLFWIPLGQQLIGALLSNLRKQKVSDSGTKRLMRDLDEYYKVVVLMECPETVDMILCMKHLCTVFSADPPEVLRLVTEDFRYLDTPTVLAMCRLRSDWVNKPPPGHWVHTLNLMYQDYKWDAPLAWEAKRSQHMENITNKNMIAGFSQLGPITLRKSVAQISSLFMAEVARLHLTNDVAPLSSSGGVKKQQQQQQQQQNSINNNPTGLMGGGANGNRNSVNITSPSAATTTLGTTTTNTTLSEVGTTTTPQRSSQQLPPPHTPTQQQQQQQQRPVSTTTTPLSAAKAAQATASNMLNSFGSMFGRAKK